MKRWRLLVLGFFVLVAIGYGVHVILHGFSAADKPTFIESFLARSARNLGIPLHARIEKNPLPSSPELLAEASELFSDRCANCHGPRGDGRSNFGQDLYPKAPDLREPATQHLTDGEIHYIIKNGVRLTGMPAWSTPHILRDDTQAWKLVLYIRSIALLPPAQVSSQVAAANSSTYVGSLACRKCHEQIYERWKKTPMANVVRDPREYPHAIIPDLATNNVSKKFTVKEIAFVYGSVWKQRYFTKIGDDYFPLPAQWDIRKHIWLPYFVPAGADWWAPYYPPDNLKRPTGPTCDGCHSVNYDIKTKQVAEWNVGCERCHGPGSEHAAHPTRANILNPARLDYVAANDTCIQCHSQGRPLANPIDGRYYDWPVGYHVGLNLRDYWRLEDHVLGQQSFTHFAEGTAHKNRMQGNDFVQSVMYRRGITCFDCHDVHGTANYAQLRKPANEICLDCHAPGSRNGPHAPTLEAHTHHKPGSPGSQCVACHMPQIQVTIPGSFVSAHTFKFISPAESDQYKIPNPCTLCHTDKTTAWASNALRSWQGFSPWRVD
ncbi:MAG TPA: cytochrome c3 family protein [Candidatus Acidoferrum sp.]|nr:cytochrome c3 family protein [Candidatus Acidoferrum sp.]